MVVWTDKAAYRNRPGWLPLLVAFLFGALAVAVVEGWQRTTRPAGPAPVSAKQPAIRQTAGPALRR